MRHRAPHGRCPECFVDVTLPGNPDADWHCPLCHRGWPTEETRRAMIARSAPLSVRVRAWVTGHRGALRG